jgi:predicted nucleotidyltransferase
MDDFSEHAMPPALADDPILKRFRAALVEMYGDRIERVVLFGSRARGDARADSDYDVAVFLKDLKAGDLAHRWRELDRLADLRSEILYDTDAFVDAKAYPAGAYRDRTSLMREIRRDGVDL